MSVFNLFTCHTDSPIKKFCPRNFLFVAGIYLSMNGILLYFIKTCAKISFQNDYFLLCHSVSQECFSWYRNCFPSFSKHKFLPLVGMVLVTGNSSLFEEYKHFCITAFKKFNKLRDFPPIFPVRFQYFLGRFFPSSRGISHPDSSWGLFPKNCE